VPTARILCVDDEPDLLEVRRKLLEKAGYDVVVARTGREAIRLFSAERFDLVLLDYSMADMDGLAVAEELKRIKSKVPIVMFSGYRSILDEAIGRVDRWLVKGQSEPEDLLSAISELLSPGGTHPKMKKRPP
jgi:CheY-like chemotaxis protein